jgi:hypothetical protein
MRRVLPDPGVWQMHLQLGMRGVQSTRNNYVQGLKIFKRLLNFITIAHLEIMK